MLKDEINLMLLSLMNNKKNFKNFYKTGYCSYSNDKSFKGAVAIVNDKGIVSFLQDVNDENKVIATASFKDKTTFVFQLIGNNFSRTHFGDIPHKCSSNREAIINDITSIRRLCTETEERLRISKPNFIRSIFSKELQSSEKELSKQDVRVLLENTIDKLNKSRKLNSRSKISPKVDTTSIVNRRTPIINSSDLDITQEI